MTCKPKDKKLTSKLQSNIELPWDFSEPHF